MANVLTRSNDFSRSGHNADEPLLTQQNVASKGIKRSFGLEMQGDLCGSEGQPLIAAIKLKDNTLHNICFAADMADRKSTRLNSSHGKLSRMPSSA